ncbi:MAG: TerB N-terminal domain-containing protein [Gammaproteobacteria bacterium]
MIVIIAAASKYFWVTVIVLSGAEVAAYALIRRMSRRDGRSVRRATSLTTQRQPDHEPTLAELTRGALRNQTGAKPVQPVRADVAPYIVAATGDASVLSSSNNSPPRISPPTVNGRPTPPPPSEDARDVPRVIAEPGDVINSAASAVTLLSDRSEHFYSSPQPSATTPTRSSFVLPRAPAGLTAGHWVSPGQSVQIAGVTISAGMIYVGTRLEAPNGNADPCLINGLLPVAGVGGFRPRQMGYWPSYERASPDERRAYLSWLAEGRCNPDCDIGYVFLFFYGLERRVILDSRDDQAAKSDWPAIIDELRRLLAIYGEQSGSFKHYAGELLSWIELGSVSGRLYAKPVPDLPRSFELPPYLRVALGQAAVDRAPLPESLALAWVRLCPDIHLRTAATRCPADFEQLFNQRYQKIFGAGLVLRTNRTRLKFVYRAASSGLLGTTITMSVGDIPDVSAVTAPVNALNDIANQCADELGPYSRLLGREPELAGSLESLLLLPSAIWPYEAKAKLDALAARMDDGCLVLTLQELVVSLGGMPGTPNRNLIRSLAGALEHLHIGMEPNVLRGAKFPSGKDKVVMFTQAMSDADTTVRPAYQSALLTLQLGAALAHADGDFSGPEVEHLRAKVNDWLELTPAERTRLRAHIQLLVVVPPAITTLKRKLEPLDAAARQTLATFMVTLAQADGYVSPDEIRFLEKIYTALGIEPKRVFSDVQAESTCAGSPEPVSQPTTRGFHLDTGRIAALQNDTARVSALLSTIFVDEEPTPEASPAQREESTVMPPPMLGLDVPQAALARLLLSRPQWTRSDLEDAAADLGVMLDGALEEINEAAFDAFDTPLCEGADPVDVNTEILEKMTA